MNYIKLKVLKKKYLAINDQKNRSGMGRVDWPFYELCQNIFGNSALANPVRLSSSLATSSSATTSSVPSSRNLDVEDDSEIERDTKSEARAEATQGLEADAGTEGLIEAGSAEEGGSETTRTQPLQSSGYSVPARRRKRTKMDHASAAIATSMAELLEVMDRAAAARDDACMQMYMEHERSLWERVSTIQERISREGRENQRSLFGLLLSRLPGPAPQTPQRPPHAISQYEHSQYEQKSIFVSTSLFNHSKET
ncbi:uncharacterized protein LOC130107599 [Lampris incognitus]|uniref:uncharacterized protein LOC130107599 n=1 Tax=Lampris incognitus TaxID=2546036 RepID=UPI0024B4A397|nr:uncharacterized protein LOC130107599 [Lampris incognitus]